MRKNATLRLVLSALFLALGLLLPFLTGNNRALGNMMSLMHIPVLLCGFVCGPLPGLAVGVATPLLRSLLVGAPPMMPVALAMAAELGVYGLSAGLLYRALPKTPAGLAASLILSMLAGRLVWGAASWLLYTLALKAPFTWQMYLTAAFVTPWPGILLQLFVIPAVVLALRKAGLVPDMG